MEEVKKELSYLEFLKEIDGKSVDEVYNLLNNNNAFITNITSTDEFLIAGEVIRRINLCDTTDSNQYSFLKRSIIYFGILEHYTKFNISSLDMGMENYNICLEMALKENFLISHFYQVIENVLEEQKLRMIRELDKLFKKMPSVQDLDIMQNKLKNMFDDESDERLKLINDILAYNDPTLQTIKDNLLDQSLMTEDNKEQINKVITKMNTLLEKEKKENGDNSNGDSNK